MDMHEWLQLTKEERAAHLKTLLVGLVEIDKVKELKAKQKDKTPLHTNRFQLEQEVLKIIGWEKEESEEI